MKKLLDYLNGLAKENRQKFSKAVGTTENYLRRAISGGVTFPAETCVAIERATGGQVTRKDLRPNDWQDIWPELAGEE